MNYTKSSTNLTNKNNSTNPADDKIFSHNKLCQESHPCITVDFVVPYGAFGGIESVLNDVALYLDKINVHVRIIQLSKSNTNWVNPQIEFYMISTDHPLRDVTDYIPICKQYLSRLGAPDIIIATPFPMLTMILKLALLENHMNSRIVSWLHASIKAYEDNAAGGAECLTYADLVLVLSRNNFNIIHTYDQKIPVRLIRNPIDISSLHFHSEYDTRSRNLYYIGRLSPEKNVSLIIKAIANAKDCWRLTIIGEGQEKKELTKLVSTLNLNNQITFTGWKDNPWDYVQSPAALILASEYEGFSLVCYEALASGIPVISTKVDGVTDIICNGVNGYLYNSQTELTDILDNMALHSIPGFNPSECKTSILPYNKPDVLKSISENILSVL